MYAECIGLREGNRSADVGSDIKDLAPRVRSFAHWVCFVPSGYAVPPEGGRGAAGEQWGGTVIPGAAETGAHPAYPHGVEPAHSRGPVKTPHRLLPPQAAETLVRQVRTGLAKVTTRPCRPLPKSASLTFTLSHHKED